MKVLLAPTNFANQPALLTRALRERSVDARHLLYAWSGRNVFGFDREHVAIWIAARGFAASWKC
jgi:hypothetical protein